MRLSQLAQNCRWGGLLGGVAIALISLQLVARADPHTVTLAPGFTPNPTRLSGTGGGDRPAATVVNTRDTPTGPCLGYLTATPHVEVTLQARFTQLEMRVESERDTTLVIAGPGGVWCNDDSGSPNPAIAGQWLPGTYRLWVGAYQPQEAPTYELYITDQS